MHWHTHHTRRAHQKNKTKQNKPDEKDWSFALESSASIHAHTHTRTHTNGTNVIFTITAWVEKFCMHLLTYLLHLLLHTGNLLYCMVDSFPRPPWFLFVARFLVGFGAGSAELYRDYVARVPGLQVRYMPFFLLLLLLLLLFLLFFFSASVFSAARIPSLPSRGV